MKISITYRLFLSILGATCLAILTLLLVMQWSINRGFIQYLDKIGHARLEQVAVELGREYAKNNSWEFLKTSPDPWDGRELNSPPDRGPEQRPIPEFMMHEHRNGPPPPPPDARHKGGPLIILDENRKAVLGSYPVDENIHFIPIPTNGKVVGYAGLLSPKHFMHTMQTQFLSEQKLALVITAAGTVVIVILISIPLARRLVQPIRAIARATNDISSGNYSTRIPVTSSDELGRLARDFNNMALTLEKHEKERRQWVADISHELRTPVAVLRGEIEALLDEIREITPDRIRSLHAETLRLNRLIDDLYQLALSDVGALSYRKENINSIEVLQESLDSLEQEFAAKNITIRKNTAVQSGTIFGDPGRIGQLFANVLENSLHYTDSKGEVVVAASTEDGRLIIEVSDTKPGVEEQDLPRLFDRLFRTEGSRSRATGGAGLGLAICKNIVETHGGSISVHPSSVGGLLVRIELPLAENVHV
jgi:two-component system, OmpR family, sensor histidine kinase BaeS